MTLEDIHALIRQDMQAVDALIQRRLASDVVLINQVGSYIINSGGKRLRPALVLLAAHACGYQGSQHVGLAAVIEFIHTATLLHGDVVDGSELRRGQETANSVWGNEASVLVGDFLYSRAFEMMVEADEMEVMKILAHTTNVIAEGEVLQLLHCHDPDTTEQRYLEVIRCKTAKLFEAAALLGAVLTRQPEPVRQALAAYGMHLGMAFQLTDDALDYSATAEQLGKNVGDDLAEGKPTLPLIHALRSADAEQKAVLHSAIEAGGREHITSVTAAIESTGAIAYTARSAKAEADKATAALAALPGSPYKDALIALAEFSVSRSY
jgi:octaprenyl-diphosphate synthase